MATSCTTTVAGKVLPALQGVGGLRSPPPGRWVDPTAEEIYARRGGNFASLLASFTAQLEYEGKQLFAIQAGTYHEGDYSWSGPTDEHRAFSIRSHADYLAARERYFPKDDYDDYDYDWTYYMLHVVAPITIIK